MVKNLYNCIFKIQKCANDKLYKHLYYSYYNWYIQYILFLELYNDKLAIIFNL